MATAFRSSGLMRLGLLAIALAGAGLTVWLIVSRSRPDDSPPVMPSPVDSATPDPRLTFQTPFRNVQPEVRYVGDQACAGCHVDIDQSYHLHPMGRSAALLANVTAVESYGERAHNPFKAGQYEAFVEKAGDKVLHRIRAKDSEGKQLPDYVTSADLVIGSGLRGRSYVCLQEGAAWQTPISWFGREARWDVSPGFDLGTGARRPIIADCLFCHVNQVDPVPLSINKFREPFPTGQAAIGCERCHGPGELHVAERSKGPVGALVDSSIVNPKHLSPELQASICAQCHLQGEERVDRRGRERSEFRPGLPLELFMSVFVRHPDIADSRLSVGQFEQVRLSRCHGENRTTLDCTGCHDPHASPKAESRDAFYRDRCIQCHGTGMKQCAELAPARQAKGESCVACHMPKAVSSNVSHVSITDHRIQRRPGPAPASRGMRPGNLPLVPFNVGGIDIPRAESERDLGIALGLLAQRLPGGQNKAVAELAEFRLNTALKSWPGDGRAWTVLSQARGVRAAVDGQLAAAKMAVEVAPTSEKAHTELALAASMVGNFDLALKSANVLVAMSPTSIEPLLIRADVYRLQNNWAKAEADCRTGLAIHPLHPRVHLVLALCLHAKGDAAGGRREADTAAALVTQPSQRTEYLRWYNLQAR